MKITEETKQKLFDLMLAAEHNQSKDSPKGFTYRGGVIDGLFNALCALDLSAEYLEYAKER